MVLEQEDHSEANEPEDVERRAVRALAMGVVLQAFADLSNPLERDEAVEFLTESMWVGDLHEPGIPFRELLPGLLANKEKVVARVRAILDGQAKVGWTDEDLSL